MFHLIIFHEQGNYGGLQLTSGQDIKELILIGGEKDLKGNLNLQTCLDWIISEGRRVTGELMAMPNQQYVANG